MEIDIKREGLRLELRQRRNGEGEKETKYSL